MRRAPPRSGCASAFDGAVSLGRVQTPTLALVVASRGRDPRLQARAVLARRGPLRSVRRSLVQRALPGRQADRQGGRRGDRRGLLRQARRDHEAGEEGGARAAAAPLRPDLAPAARKHALRLLGSADARRRAEALRGAQGAHLSAHELPLPAGRHDRGDQADRRPRRPKPGVLEGRFLRDAAGQTASRPRGQ